jgi:hypothetical protein
VGKKKEKKSNETGMTARASQKRIMEVPLLDGFCAEKRC